MFNIKSGDRVLVVWSGDSSGLLKDLANVLKETPEVSLKPENLDRLDLANHGSSTFDKAIIAIPKENYALELFSKIIKLLKPEGSIYVPIVSDLKTDDILSLLKLSGFINGSLDATELTASKPKYEVGAAVKLSFATKLANPQIDPKKKAAAIWSVNGDDVDEEEDQIDPDELLDEEDKAKPDPATLRVCGTTGKRKACKNCSCGLADELAAENKSMEKSEQPKSSCGNCYLGDAFRCSSCPYMGMPAFKPGEKVKLADNFLQADI